MDTEALNLSEQTTETISKKQIHDVLLSIGMPPNLLGYRYIVYSLELIIDNPDYIFYITKGLYIDVALHFNSTPARVERAIRNAINAAWLHGNYEYIAYVFKNCVNPSKGVPCNSLFLSRLYDYFTTQEQD